MAEGPGAVSSMSTMLTVVVNLMEKDLKYADL